MNRQGMEKAMAAALDALNLKIIEHRLEPVEAETVLARCLVLAIANYAQPGREDAALEIVIDYLRKALPLAMRDVARARALTPHAGTA